MVSVRPIRTVEDHEAALDRLHELMVTLSPEEGQIEDADHLDRLELEILADLIEVYEDKHFPVGRPSVVGAIEFHMDQQDMTPRDLIPIIGSRAKVSEVLAGKRDVTMSMARALHRHLGIPAEVLLQDSGGSFDPMLDEVVPSRFPLKAMVKAGWIPDGPDLMERAEEIVSELVRRAGGHEVAVAPLYRRNDHRRINAKTDEYALRAWCWQVMATSSERQYKVDYRPGTVTEDFLREVAQLSSSEDGPRRARNFLYEHGIGLEYVPHLRRTYLDGAALRIVDGRPVVGLTLRYDRIDNFWFTLLHELAHVGLHLDGADDEAFVDDHSLRDVEDSARYPKEAEADQLAENALIPSAVWNGSAVSDEPTPMAVIDLAWGVGVHPAIVAGRVRHKSGNYRLLSQFVGTGQVRRQFEGSEV